MSGGEITERAQQLLKTLVERYIADGQPVASRALVEASGLPISPATARNVMSDLEERGLISSPHTSAGRIPTAKGYRLFVDSLLSAQPMVPEQLGRMIATLDTDAEPKALATMASQLLSDVTCQAGLVTVPKQNRRSLRQVEFLPLSDNRVLVILVINEKEVQNRVVHTKRVYTELELQQAANLINQRHSGQSLSEIRSSILTAMRSDKESIDQYMQASLDLASQAFAEEESAGEGATQDYVVAGETQLISADATMDLDKLKGLFDAFHSKQDMLELVDRCLNADGVQIYIGEESGYEVLGDFSIVTAPYQAEGETLGVLGVIGPTRMAYERVIPIVDVTAQLLSGALDRS